MIVYKIQNALNGKTYIGQTTRTLKERIIEHKAKKSLVGQEMLLYGVENFKIEIIAHASSVEDLLEKEQEYIKKYNSMFPNGYNFNKGGKGNLGWRPSEEWVKKQAKLNAGENNPMYGKRINLKKVICVETQEIFNSIKEAAQKYGINPSAISGVCRCRPKYNTAGGLTWRYVGDMP